MFTLVLALCSGINTAHSSTATFPNLVKTKPGTVNQNSVVTDGGDGTKTNSPRTTTIATTSSFTSTTSAPGDDTKKLTKDLCSNTSGLTGTFKHMILTGTLSPKEEGANITMNCTMKADPQKCRDLVNGLANSTQLYTSKSSTTSDTTDDKVIEHIKRIYMVGGNIKFIFSLHHLNHNERFFYCKATNDDKNLVLESERKRFGRIIQKWDVFMSPTDLRTEISSTFQLTCYTNHSEATKHIVWKRKKDETGAMYSKVLESGDNSDGNLFISTGNKSSILTMTQNEEWKGIFKCQTSHDHSNAPYAIASVEVKSKDKSVLNATTIASSAVAAAVLLIILGFIMRKRALQRKIEITTMLMQVQEAHTNPQTAAGDASLLNTNEPASNCYSIEGLNLGIESLGTETLSETFIRITTRWQTWQVDRSILQITSILGEGNFGSVYLGSLPDQYMPGMFVQVAVKTIKASRLDKQAITEFEKEISVMTSLQHENIISLIGLCTETMPMNIIMEYMINGPLNKFLMEKAPSKVQDTILATIDLLCMGIQPCNALEYLANKNIVHRDISARNCLVGESYTVKLADFGLSRGTTDDGKNYYKKDGGMVPVKWMAPEALTFGKYTASSDVWACAVLLWEIFSFGAIPYQGYSNQQVIVFINNGGRLEKPDQCPQSIWRYICMCWTKTPEERITIGGLSNMLEAELECLKSKES